MKAFPVILSFALYLLFAFCMISCMNPEERASPQVKNTKPETGTIKGETDTVVISGMKFVPDVITVKQGTTIVFINNDMVSHDVTEESTKAWSSKPLAPSKSWRLIADKSAKYYCSIHAVMKGEVIVSR
jgi:plastocyanin